MRPMNPRRLFCSVSCMVRVPWRHRGRWSHCIVVVHRIATVVCHQVAKGICAFASCRCLIVVQQELVIKRTFTARWRGQWSILRGIRRVEDSSRGGTSRRTDHTFPIRIELPKEGCGRHWRGLLVKVVVVMPDPLDGAVLVLQLLRCLLVVVVVVLLLVLLVLLLLEQGIRAKVSCAARRS